MSLPAWEVTQERTFARWCNQHLSHKNITIPDNGLAPALQTGVSLCILLENLSEKNLKGVNQNPATRFQQLGNNSIALKFLASENIVTTNIGPEDIVDKKRKLVMGLIWTLILHYQIIQGGSGAGKQDDAKSELLKWVQNQVRPYDIDVNNFDKDWKDGRVLCALVDSLRPNSINVRGLDPNRGFDNAKQGIDSAETELLIPRMMEPEDFANVEKPDELSVMTYASLFRDAMNSGRLKQAAPKAAADTGYHHNPVRPPQGSGATVEVFLSLATFATKVKKDQTSLKYLLDKKGIKYVEYDVGTNEAKKVEMQQKSGQRTLPQLFINGNYIGGYDEAQQLEEVGELSKLLGQ